MEMDYKEKYEKALERARKLNADNMLSDEATEEIFPELKESEDERIRKHIVEIMKSLPGGYWYGQKEKDDSLAWLERQKEQPKEFTHHEVNESLIDAVTHQMEDDGNVDDFVRRGIDDIALKYAELGAKWQKEQNPAENGGKELLYVSNKSYNIGFRDGKREAESKQEWSVEDETCLEYALWCVMKTRHFVAKDACDLDACRCAERWLRSLHP